MKILLPESEIHSAVADLARKIGDEYRGRPLTLLGILNGSLMFLADLARQIDIPMRVGLIQASSYRGHTTVPKELLIQNDGLPDVAGRDVLLLDDIFDTGQTLAALLQVIGTRGPHTLRSAVLLWKEGRQRVEITPDYYCFRIPDVFVVGYGLDYNDDYRHLPYVAALEENDLTGQTLPV